MVEGYFDRLPCEILQNIALMLPFNSIIQLKYSSKFWYNLLTDPKFVDLHLTHALKKPSGYLFSAPPILWSQAKACYVVEESGDDLHTSKIFEYTFYYPESESESESEICTKFQSSGGLMCAYSSYLRCFRIFNPHIAEEVQVPRDPKFQTWNFDRFVFSYSPSIKEYKIFKMGKLYCGSPAAEICTLGSNIWRDVQNVPKNLWYKNPYTQCQGNLFWMVGYDLYFFDIVSEKFHVIPGPHVTHDSNTRVNLMTKGLISMGDTVGYVDNNNRLWVLEDKTKGIWINRYDFSNSTLYKGTKLIGTLENGHLFSYNDDYPTNFFSQDMRCPGFKVMKMNLDKHESEEQSRIKYLKYMASHVIRSFVSPVRIMNMGNRLNHKRKRVLDT